MTQAPTIPEEERLLEEEFELFDDWRDKIEYVIELGHRLPDLPEAHRCEENKVKGCQSQVWMVAELGDDGRLRFLADSDSVLVRGVIGLLMRLYDNRTPKEVLEHPPKVIETIGLGQQLTPGRQNGLYAMVRRIQEFASGYAGRAEEVPAK